MCNVLNVMIYVIIKCNDLCNLILESCGNFYIEYNFDIEGLNFNINGWNELELRYRSFSILTVLGKLASLNRSWQSNEGAFHALGWQELNPWHCHAVRVRVTGPHFSLIHCAKGAVSTALNFDIEVQYWRSPISK